MQFSVILHTSEVDIIFKLHFLDSKRANLTNEFTWHQALITNGNDIVTYLVSHNLIITSTVK